MSSSPELLDFHEKMFREARETGKDVYGDFESLPPITRAGHFRRMELIAGFDIRPPAESVAVDFGTGPWGFAKIFPKLRAARKCIGIDVSPTALEMAAGPDAELGDRITHLTSDGEQVPLEDDSVDIFWGGEVVEHVRDPIVFLQEVSRVCRDGADVILSTPNRDAIFYRAHGLDYTIGPEHLALLNHAELLEVASRFFDVRACVGFQSSISPELDGLLREPAQLQLLQEQARDYPSLASGLVLHARNNRAKYEANRRSYRLDEQLWSHPAVTATGALTKMLLFADVHGVLLDRGQTMTFTVSGRKVILLVWGHDWSGEAEVTCAGRTARVELYSRFGGFKRVVFDDLPPGRHPVQVRRTDRKCERAYESQVIVYKAMGYDY